MIPWIPTDTELPEPGEYVIFWDKEDKAARTGYYIPHTCSGGTCLPAKWVAFLNNSIYGINYSTSEITHWAPLESITGPHELSMEAAVQGVIDNLKAEREKCREWGDRSDEYAAGAEMVIIPGAILAYDHAIGLLQQITDDTDGDAE